MLGGVKPSHRTIAGLALSVAAWTQPSCTPASTRPVPVVAGQAGPNTQPGDGAAPSRSGDFAAKISTPAIWDALSFRPPTTTLAGTEVVKVILDRTDGAIYFLQSERWPIHYYFARRFLSRADAPVAEEGVFNKKEYHTAERRFVLGTLSRYPGEVWAFELYAGDELDIESTARAFAQIKAAVFFGDRLRYRPVPAGHDRDPRTRALLPVVETQELFGNVKFQPLELGEAFGFLRIFRPNEPFDPARVRPFDIVVLGALPEDIPVVSAVVSDELQAPLGHINVLCHNRKTPNMSLRGATQSAEIRALEGKLVKLTVEGQGFKLEAATQADAERSWESKRPRQPLSPARDDRDVGLPSLSELDLSHVPRVGAKAAQLGLVTQLAAGRFRVPRGFALPMHAYAQFLAQNGFDRRIEAMLADKGFSADPEARRRMLDELREAMEKAPVPEAVLGPLLKRMKELLPQGKVRLRSSTNAEDLPGFNGAGLYRSTRVDPTDREDVIRGLRKVWSSVWLVGAHEERAYYRIDSRTVGMAILVQESVDDDVLNGVAVTVNPFSQGQPGFFINAQLSKDQGSVTGARGNEVPEQVLIYTFEDGQGIERLSMSSRAGGKAILTPDDLARMTAALGAIHEGFTGDRYGMSGAAVDVEFLVAGAKRELVVVQARPFTMVWPTERRWLDDSGRPLVPRAR
jgi:rifampicin phosphotransferase